MLTTSIKSLVRIRTRKSHKTLYKSDVEFEPSKEEENVGARKTFWCC